MSKKKILIGDIHNLSDFPSEYAKELDAPITPAELISMLERWECVASDALALARNMTADDFSEFIVGLRQERNGEFGGEVWAGKYNTITMPIVLFFVAMATSEFAAPWGLTFQRMRDAGRIEIKDGIAWPKRGK